MIQRFSKSLQLCQQLNYGFHNLVKRSEQNNNFRGYSSFASTIFSKGYNFGVCSIIEDLGKVGAERQVPDHIIKPAYFYALNEQSSQEGPVEIKNVQQIHGMRRTCSLAANILESTGKILKIGLTTDEIDEFVHNKIIENNAYPSPLRYMGFPKSVCTSVNNIACHGIPDDRPLQDGDIINIDVTVYYEGFHGDCSKTFLVGNVDERGNYLVESTRECLDAAIKVCGPNVPMKLIGKTISLFANKKDLRVIPHFIGHGIGSFFHGPPEVLPYENSNEGVMKPGMTFTIEPILTLGDGDIEIWDDGWTASSVDRSRSAQFEHTILVTETGCDILTIPDEV